MFGDVGRLPEDGFVLKSDARTRVWCAYESPPGAAQPTVRVIKLYQDPPLRQWLAWLLGIHPAQREARWAQRLHSRGLTVALPLETRWQDGRVCLVYPWLGPSMMNLISQHRLPVEVKTRLAQQIATDVATLTRQGLFNRDHKLSNIVVSDAYELCLLDVGGVRPATGRSYLVRMLRALYESARRAGASRSDCCRVLRELRSRLPEVGDGKALAHEVIAAGG